MDFVYYLVRKKDMVILDGAKDMVTVINMAQNQNCACLILQACVITEVGQDMPEIQENDDFAQLDDYSDFVESDDKMVFEEE